MTCNFTACPVCRPQESAPPSMPSRADTILDMLAAVTALIVLVALIVLAVITS